MRRSKVETQGLFSSLFLEQRVPQCHPLRPALAIVDNSLANMDRRFNARYSSTCRPSIPLGFLLRAPLLQVSYDARYERRLIEQLIYSLLFRWFVGLTIDDNVWVPMVISRNDDRLLDHGTRQEFFRSVLDQALSQNRLSEERRSVDGWFFCGWARRNETYACFTDSDAHLYQNAACEAPFSAYLGYVLREHRHGLIARQQVTTADDTAEVDAIVQLVDDLGGTRRIALAPDKGYERPGYIQDLRDHHVTPHVARKRKGSEIEGRATRHVVYTLSMHVRRRIKSIFGWMKTVGGVRKTRCQGLNWLNQHFSLVTTAYNLVRMVQLGVI